MNRLIKYILFSLVVNIFITACYEEDDFSSDPSSRLEFSCDTISFDTLFSTIGSPTAVMKVYNRSGSALRINSVQLTSGGATGFRVNADGQYATVIRNLEIRDNDSLYVFVEVTPDKNGADAPLLLSDSIQFTLESGVEQFVTLLAYGRDVDILRARTILSDTLISAGHYIVYDSLVVAEGATLSLGEDCRLYFHAGAGLTVRGTLNAAGSAERPVLMRGDRTDNMFSYLPYDRVPGQWAGVTFAATSTGNILKFCDIRSADFGVFVESGDTAVQRLTVESSSIRNVYGNALESVRGRVDVSNSLIANAGGNCVKVVGGRVRFVHCTIANFFVFTQRDVALALHNSLDGEPAPLREALFANCIITGSKSDELMGYLTNLGDTIDNCRNYRFVSSLVNTIPSDDENFVDIVYDDSDASLYGKEHFILVDNSVFDYKFNIVEESAARGIAAQEYSQSLPSDLSGNVRPAVAADAGCYQFVPPAEE